MITHPLHKMDALRKKNHDLFVYMRRASPVCDSQPFYCNVCLCMQELNKNVTHNPMSDYAEQNLLGSY